MRFTIGGTFSVWLNGKYWGSFHNHVTDYGLNTLVTKSLDTLMGKLHVGSGNTAPADSDTALVTEVATTTTIDTTEYVYDATDGYAGRRRKYSFAVGVATGTLAELGLSDGTSLFNRQLFQDQYGNNTTITVGASDTLEVLCEVRVYMPLAVNTKAANSNFTIGSESYPSNYSMASGFYSSSRPSSQWGSMLVFPYKALNSFEHVSMWELMHTTNDYSSGDSGVMTAGGGTDASSVTMTPYVLDSFELEFILEWVAGTLAANNYSVLALHVEYVLFGANQKFLEIGISSPYNQASETIWQDSHVYTEGDRFIPTLTDSFIYEVTTGGTSHTSAPVWPTTVGGTVTDGGGVEYECVAPLLRVESSESLTLNVTLSWGRET
jgi:hypothetical protein